MLEIIANPTILMFFVQGERFYLSSSQFYNTWVSNYIKTTVKNSIVFIPYNKLKIL